MPDQPRARSRRPRKGKPRTAFVPKADIELDVESGGFRIVLDKRRLGDLFDQGADMLESAGQGCISAPGGPSC